MNDGFERNDQDEQYDGNLESADAEFVDDVSEDYDDSDDDASYDHDEYDDSYDVDDEDETADDDPRFADDDELTMLESVQRVLNLYEAEAEPELLDRLLGYMHYYAGYTIPEGCEDERPRIIAALKQYPSMQGVQTLDWFSADDSQIAEERYTHEKLLEFLAQEISNSGEPDPQFTKTVIDLFHGGLTYRRYRTIDAANGDYDGFWTMFTLISPDTAAAGLCVLDPETAFDTFQQLVYHKIINHQNPMITADDEEGLEKNARLYHRTQAAIEHIFYTGHADALNVVSKLLVAHHYHEARIMGLADEFSRWRTGTSYAEKAALSVQQAIHHGQFEWTQVINTLFAELSQQKVQRDEVHPDWLRMVSQAVLSAGFTRRHNESEDDFNSMPPDVFAERYVFHFTDYLVQLSATVYAGNREVGPLLGDLAIQFEKRHIVLQSIERYERANPAGVDDVKTFRIAMGSQDAIEPLMQVLQENLDSNFQQVIRTLNDQTQARWLQTIRDARIGFYTRMVMSIIVFVVGIFLVMASSWQFLFGETTSEELFGTGVSFVAGLGTMFAVIYTGPLKEIRKSINDLSSANMSFISYIHRILQISNSYSFLYLKQKIDFDEMQKSSNLLESAMRDTVAMMYINPDNDVFTEHMWKETMRNQDVPSAAKAAAAPPQVQAPPSRDQLPPSTGV